MTTEPSWPPRSARAALLSSPGGRRKVRNLYEHQISPPRASNHGDRNQRNGTMMVADHELRDHNDVEDDEETLQLQLKALEAKIKLKRLQRQKSPSKDQEPPLERRLQSTKGTNHQKDNIQSFSKSRAHTADTQVPASPTKRAVSQAQEHTSPRRVLLGIDKGLKGRNVTLRPPSLTTHTAKDDESFSTSSPSAGPFGYRHQSDSSHKSKSTSSSFSQKIAEIRKGDKLAMARLETMHAQKSHGFGIPQEQIDSLRKSAASEPGTAEKVKIQAETLGYSRDQVLNGIQKANGAGGAASKSNLNRGTVTMKRKTWQNPNGEDEAPGITFPTVMKSAPATTVKPTSAARARDLSQGSSAQELFEPFSSLHLTQRLLPHDLLTSSFQGKSILRLPDLLAKVKSPDFCLPEEMELDYVVLAIVGAKSPPRTHQNAASKAPRKESMQQTSFEAAEKSLENEHGRFMILTLTDLKWSIDLYLFTSAFSRFYKLSAGTVVAILNPNIMPPPRGRADTGRFSLSLNSNEDTVLEIGNSRDLGWCKAICKSGKQCTDWIDKRHTEYCEFHVDLVVDRQRRSRMETQGMSAPFAPGGRRSGRTGEFGTKRRRRRMDDGSKRLARDPRAKDGSQYDHVTASKFFVSRASTAHLPSMSTASLLDADDASSTMRGESRTEQARKRLAEREKEKDLARRLAANGNGAGSDYLRHQQDKDNNPSTSADSANHQDRADKSMRTVSGKENYDATHLGLLGNRAHHIHLSPLKKRSNLKRDRSDETMTRQGSQAQFTSPSKKTRFVTAAGIKDPGRDSLTGQRPDSLHVSRVSPDETSDLEIEG